MPNDAEFLHEVIPNEGPSNRSSREYADFLHEEYRRMMEYARIREQTYGTITVNAGSGTHVIVDNTMTFHRV